MLVALIVGREGTSSFINGTYFMLSDLRHDGRPVFMQARGPDTTGTVRGCACGSGAMLFFPFFIYSGNTLAFCRASLMAGQLVLYYHIANDAWAVSQELGSLVRAPPFPICLHHFVTISSRMACILGVMCVTLGRHRILCGRHAAAPAARARGCYLERLQRPRLLLSTIAPQSCLFKIDIYSLIYYVS